MLAAIWVVPGKLLAGYYAGDPNLDGTVIGRRLGATDQTEASEIG
jgi:hypothetical protein